MPIYASPEVWKEESYSTKADVWSLGCVLYELCTLKHPFRAEDMHTMYRKISKGFFQRIPAHFSQELSEVLKNMLHISANSRVSCEKILQLLRNSRFVKENSRFVKENQGENASFLLKTLKFPKKVQDLPKILPKSRYSTENAEILDEKRESTDFRHGKSQFFLPKLGKLAILKETVENREELAPLFENRVFFIEGLQLKRRIQRKNWRSCADERELLGNPVAKPSFRGDRRGKPAKFLPRVG